MEQTASFNDRLDASFANISAAEQLVARFIQENREEVLIASASSLAKQVGTSDATVVRTAKALGFSGLDDLRRTLARDIRENTSLASRMAKTINKVGEVGNDLSSALGVTLDINQHSLESLRADISNAVFENIVHAITGARRVFIFGIGPSSAMVDYFSIELDRLGLDTVRLTQTGLLLADGIQKFRPGDLLIMFAYGRVYQELSVLLERADLHGMNKVLISDNLGEKLLARVDHILPVARGRINMLSMHTATLALVEALIVGVAMNRPEESLASLDGLNEVRTALGNK